MFMIPGIFGLIENYFQENQQIFYREEKQSLLVCLICLHKTHFFDNLILFEVNLLKSAVYQILELYSA
jgi:hypothetical protein